MGEGSSEKPWGENEEVYEPSKASQFFVVWRKLKKSKLAVIGSILVLFFVVVALFADIIAPYSLTPGQFGVLQPPSTRNLLGTDSFGRDVFSLVIHGARISLLVGIGAVSIELLIGLSVGMASGYFGGKIDEILMRITDVILSLPTLMLLILAVSMFMARGILIITVIMGVLGWPFMARVVRSEFLSLKESTFVEAARAMGASSKRIILRHILPNAVSMIIVLVTIDIPDYIFYEATLSFLGFGDPTSPSWGNLVELGWPTMRTAWWVAVFAGFGVFFASLGFNLLGDGLRDAFDIKIRE